MRTKYIDSSNGDLTGFLNLTIDSAPIIPSESAILLEITLVITKVVIGNNINVRVLFIVDAHFCFMKVSDTLMTSPDIMANMNDSNV